MRRSLVAALLSLALPLAAPAAAQELAAAVDALCQPLVDGGKFVGFVVGVLDGDTELVRGYGRVQPDRDGVPDGDTVYEIGSISKVFTALLLSDAVERGVVAAADPLQKHLPAGVTVPVVDGKEVLLWHLATHTSGLPRLPGGETPDKNDPYAHLTRERVYAAVDAVSLRREPGSGYEYSNLGAGVLGLVLADAQEASYAELLQQRIAGPLGLRDTVVLLQPAQQKRLAPPFDGEGDAAHTWDLAALAGAGGIRSTVRDLLRFARAELEPAGTPLAAAVARSQQKLYAGGPALAWGWHFARDGATLWHNGQTGGYHGFLGIQPAHRRAVCILSNTARGEIDAVGDRILQHLHGVQKAK